MPPTDRGAGTVLFDGHGLMRVGSSIIDGSGLVAPALVSAAQPGQWQSRSSGDGVTRFGGLGNLLDGLFVDPTNPDIMIGTIESSFVRSQDGGAAWQPLRLFSYGAPFNLRVADRPGR